MTHNLIIELDLKLLDAERFAEKKWKAVEVHASHLRVLSLPQSHEFQNDVLNEELDPFNPSQVTKNSEQICSLFLLSVGY